MAMATAPDQKRSESLISGADAVIESLVRNGVEVIFAYPGGASMPLHQSLTRFGDRLRTILPRHEQGGGFAAQGQHRKTESLAVLRHRHTSSPLSCGQRGQCL